MENQKTRPSTTLSPSVAGQFEKFDETDFIEYFGGRGYAPRQLRNMRYGLKYLQTYTSIEKLIPQISSLSFIKEIGAALREQFSVDIAKISLTTTHRLRDYFLDKGVIENDFVIRTEGYFGEVERGIHHYVSVERKYSDVHADRVVKAYERFTNYLVSTGKHDFRGIDQTHVFEYYAELKPCRATAVTLRVVLQFLFREGYLKADYSFLVLCARAKDSEVRKFLSPEDIQRLLDSIDRNSKDGKRTFLFFILMARLSLRGREILRLKIDDVDWGKSRIFIHGKQEKLTTLPFSNEVGEALIDYLKHSKRINNDYLIVSKKPPHKKLSRTGRFCKALHRMYENSGVKCPTKRVRINVFRHSLATGKLNSGSSIIEVRNLMRHKNIVTTMIYAKYNLPSLANLAGVWPEAVT